MLASTFLVGFDVAHMDTARAFTLSSHDCCVDTWAGQRENEASPGDDVLVAAVSRGLSSNVKLGDARPLDVVGHWSSVSVATHLQTLLGQYITT